ncbi:MAG: MobB family relaxase [Cellulophaga sp.]
MYIAITKQHSGPNYGGSVADFVNYLEKENEGKSEELQEHFFDQYNDKISSNHVIKDIDGNTAKLKKTDPKFYSLVVSPSAKELRYIGNDPEKLRAYTRELMKDYAASFHRNDKVTVDDIKYYAKLEHERKFRGTDKQVIKNQPYASKILELKNEIRNIESGAAKGNVERIKLNIGKLEKEAPHQQNGKRIVQGMQKDGMQTHIHIIVSTKDVTNTRILSPGAKFKESETQLHGKTVKQGFNRDKFFEAAEKTFDKTFGYDRNFVESYKAKKMVQQDPKKFFAMLIGLPTNQKQAARALLFKAGINVPTIPTNLSQLAFRAIMKLKKGVQTAMSSGSIGV